MQFTTSGDAAVLQSQIKRLIGLDAAVNSVCWQDGKLKTTLSAIPKI